MFSLMKKLGEHLRIQGADLITQLSDEIGKNYHYGLAICFTNHGTYSGITLTEGKKGIIYKDIHPKKPPFTFVLRYTPKLQNLLTRMCKNAKNLIEWGEKENKSVMLFRNCLSEVENDISAIIEDINEGYPSDSNPKRKVFLYWAFQGNDGSISPFCSTNIVQEYLSEQMLKDFAFKKKGSKTISVIAENTICQICGSQKQKVYGNFSEIACYVLDKPGMITGGFSYKQTTHNFPICSECIIDILGSKTYIKKNLQFSFGKLNYWIIPDTMDNQIYPVILNEISEQRTRQTLGRKLKSITNQEEEIFDYITFKSEQVGTLYPITLNLFFFKSSQASWRIISEIRRVLPTRLEKIFKAKTYIEKHPEMIMTKKEKKNGYNFTLNTIKPFCGDMEKTSEKKLLSYLDAIFSGKKLQWRNVVSDLSNCIIITQKSKPEYSRTRLRDAWAIYIFLRELEIININEGENHMKEKEMRDIYSEFMEEHPDYFGNIVRKASFLTGAYIGAVLYAQYKENKKRKIQPFTRKYSGRKLTKDRLVYLFNEGKKKLIQYKKLGLVHDLEPLLAETWVEVGDKWDLNKEDTTFAFNLGCTLGSKLNKKSDESNENKEGD